MCIWKFISAKLPNNKHLEVFYSLNIQKKQKERRKKQSRRTPYFGAFWRLLFLLRGNISKVKRKANGGRRLL
nr:MAG TPA: hypothetical protein [Caudoviricetes sp.]